MGHALLAPSAASRWLVCTASVRASEGMEDKKSIHAARGTVLHDIAATALEDGAHTSEVGDTRLQEGFEIKLTEKDLDQVADYVNYVLEQQANATGTLLVEQKLDLSGFIPESSGTADTVIIDPARELHVIDAKFGSRKVYAYENPQLIAYGIGAWVVHAQKNFIEQLRITIAQPALDHYDSVVLNVDELADWIEKFQKIAPIAFAGGPDAEYVPGDHCTFCPAKPNCKALKELAHEKAANVFTDVSGDKPTVSAILPDDIGAELELVGALKAWIDMIIAEAHERIEAGRKVPGFKLVMGKRPPKAWKDEDETEIYLRAQKVKVATMFASKLRSPTQMIKELGKDFDFKELIEIKNGKPTVVPESDKRKAIASGAELIFD